jgi:hypothetical protein
MYEIPAQVEYSVQNIKFSHIHQIGIWEKFISISSPVYVNNFKTVKYIVVIRTRLSKDRFHLFR